MICELCNGAYHLACIATLKDKDKLPRTPDDDEWFCRGCVKRGVPEEILDRVGRESQAHYLVKWMGRASTEVSWESALCLDTSWGRKVIKKYLEEVEPLNREKGSILPPCHPLVDTLRAAAAEKHAASQASGGAKKWKGAVPTPDVLTAGTQLLACLRVLCVKKRIYRLHPLAPLAYEIVRVARTQGHPKCVSFSPWLANLDPMGQQACAAVDRAAATVSAAVKTLEASINREGNKASSPRKGGADFSPRKVICHRGTSSGEARSLNVDDEAALEAASTTAILAKLKQITELNPPPAHVLAPVMRAAAKILITLENPEWTGKHPDWQMSVEKAANALKALRSDFDGLLGTPPAASTAAAASAAATSGTTFRSYLLYLKENRETIRAANPTFDQREIERVAAIQFNQLEEEEAEALGKRAMKHYQENVGAIPPALCGLARRGGEASCGTNGKKRRPCSVCDEYDRRDALVCSTCNQRFHLMCLWPPMESAPEGEWKCDDCRSAAPPLRHVPIPGEELEAEVEDSFSNKIVWKKAIVLKSVPPERFVLMINPEEEEDFIEEYGMEDEGKEWRRPASAIEALTLARAAAEEAAADVERGRAAAALALQTDMVIAPCDKKLIPLVEEFYRDGLCLLKEGITPDQVEAAEDVVEKGYKHYMHAVKTLDLQEKLQDVGFYEIKMRSAGRYDLQLPELSSPAFSFLTTDAPWMPLVHALLGSDAVLTHFGCMLSFPGSAVQPWHSDGPHIRGCGEGGAAGYQEKPDDEGDEGEEGDKSTRTKPFVAPVHALNVFVPLVDLTTETGPTEFVPGTHFDFDHKSEHRIITCDAGSAILFDYRLKHRGLGNRSQEDRPLLYLTYARPFWLDIYNFDKKRYNPLPKVAEKLDRGDRMQKRQRVGE